MEAAKLLKKNGFASFFQLATKCEKSIFRSGVMSMPLQSESIHFQGKRAKLFERKRVGEPAWK
jgi:hypothetical protein